MRRTLLVVLLLATTSDAIAAPGDSCFTADAAYYGTPRPPVRTGEPAQRPKHCVLLCDGISDSGNDTECKPTAPINFDAYTMCTFSIGKGQTDCEPGPIYIEEASNAASSSPTMWTTIETLSGFLSPLVSSFDLLRRPRTHLRARLAAITDPQCTEVDVIIECQDLRLP